MRKAISAPPRLPFGARWELGVTIASTAVAYGLLLLTCTMTIERLVDTVPPEILAGLLQSAVTAGLAP